MINLNLSAATRWGLNLVLLLSGIIALYWGKTIFIPTIIALLLACMLGPAASWLNRRGIPLLMPTISRRFPWVLRVVRLRFPWSLACAIVVGGLVTLTFLLMLGFGLAIPKIVQDLPTDSKRQQDLYDKLRAKLEDMSPMLRDSGYFTEKADELKIIKPIAKLLNPEGDAFLGLLGSVAGFGANWIWEWVLIMFILLFLLMEGPMLSRRVVEIFGPSPEVQNNVVDALKDMANQIRTYLVWRTIINFMLGILVGVVYKELGLSQPWMWGMLTAVLCYVPYIGPIAAGIPPIIDAFVSCDNMWYTVAVFAFYLIIINVEGYLIVPLVMGRHMELNATTVMLACVFWELVWGPAGLFLAMPLMAAVKAICAHVPGWEAWANLMGTRDPHVPSDEPRSAKEDDFLYDTQVMTDAEAAVNAGLRQEMMKRK